MMAQKELPDSYFDEKKKKKPLNLLNLLFNMLYFLPLQCITSRAHQFAGEGWMDVTGQLPVML